MPEYIKPNSEMNITVANECISLTAKMVIIALSINCVNTFN